MAIEIKVVKEPGQRSWASSLAKIPEPYRTSLHEFLNDQLKLDFPQKTETHHQGLSQLEKQMLKAGKSLSTITYAGFIAYHLIENSDVESACLELRSGRVNELMVKMQGKLSKTSKVLLIGDDPNQSSVVQAIDFCKKIGDVGVIIAGPGSLMENVARQWALDVGWPSAYLKTPDGSCGDLWHAQAGREIEQSVKDLFDHHQPTLVALLEPVRLPATQCAIEQATRRKIKMVTFETNRLNFNFNRL